ncbi:hypothetical protein FQN49_008022 [Arthroderma sp. PD_2]|nr:hypothetical protein FQN49_008022 [Arthroderma sp. PD_2]
MLAREAESKPSRGLLGAPTDQPQVERQDMHRFRGSADGSHDQSDIYVPSIGMAQNRDTPIEQKLSKMSPEYHSMAAYQAPVAYGLPPPGRDSALTQTDLESEHNPKKSERKLNVLDLASRLRNRYT